MREQISSGTEFRTVNGSVRRSGRAALRLLLPVLTALSLLLFLPHTASSVFAADRQLKVKKTGFTVFESADVKDCYVVTMVAQVTNPNSRKTVLNPNGTFIVKAKNGKNLLEAPAGHTHIAPKDTLYFVQTAVVPKKEGKPAKVTFTLEKSEKGSFSTYVSERDWKSTDFKVSGLKIVNSGNDSAFEGTVKSGRSSGYIPVAIIFSKGGRLKGQVVGVADKESGEFHIPFPVELQKKLAGAAAKAAVLPDNQEIFD